MHPQQGPVSYTDQYLLFEVTRFRSFLPFLSVIIRTRSCSSTGVLSSCGACLFPVSSLPHEDELWVSWVTHYSPVLHCKSIGSPLFTCAPSLPSLAVSLDSLKFLLCTSNPNTRAFLVQGAPMTFLFLKKSIGTDIYRQIYEHCIVWLSWFTFFTGLTDMSNYHCMVD